MTPASARLSRRLSLYRFLDDLVLIYPLYALMFADSGLSTLQIASLLIAWSATAVVLEIPSGLLGDLVSRRLVVASSQLFKAAAYLIWLLIPSYGGFLAGFLAWGIKGAVESGTLEAGVYDALQEHGDSRHYALVMGRAATMEQLAIVLAGFGAAGAMTLGGYPLVLVCSAGAVLAAGAVAVGLPLQSAPPRTTEQPGPWRGIGSGLVELRRRNLLPLLVFVAAAAAASVDEFNPLYLGDVGVPRPAVGLVFVAFAAVEAAASWHAHRLQAYGNALAAILGIGGMLLVGAALLYRPLGIALLVAFAGAHRITRVLLAARFQHRVARAGRATVSSVLNFVTEICSALAVLGFGLASNAASNRLGFALFGIVALALAAIGLRALRPRNAPGN